MLPLLKPALVAALVYSFVRAMTTVSAVIFLVSAENELATTYIIGRVGNGDYGVALAYCTVLIVLMLARHVALIQWLVGERAARPARARAADAADDAARMNRTETEARSDRRHRAARPSRKRYGATRRAPLAVDAVSFGCRAAR